MDYERMTFTDNDRERLLANKEIIIDWIMENIVPNMDEEARFYVDFGGTYQAPGSWQTTENYHFGVYGAKRTFCSGGGRKTDGYIGCGQKYGGLSDAFETIKSPWEIYPIVDNWRMIKESLLSQVETAKRSRKSIYEFKV